MHCIPSEHCIEALKTKFGIGFQAYIECQYWERIPHILANAVIQTSLNLNDCDSIPNGALNTNRINIALNRFIEYPIQRLGLNPRLDIECQHWD